MAEARSYLRVTEKDTGHKVSILAALYDETTMRLLKQDAVDHNGDPLEPEYADHKSPSNSGQTATHNKES